MPHRSHRPVAPAGAAALAVLVAGALAGGASTGAAERPAGASAPSPSVQAPHGSATGGVARWPGTRITYSDASRLPRTVRAAVHLWNRATSSVRLVRAPAGRRGQIHISGAAPCGVGRACARYPPDGSVFLPTRGRGVDRPEDLLTLSLVVHELGHALGLPHAGGCSVMTTYVGFRECPPVRGPARYRCGPQRRDAAALARLYGGRARTDGTCRHPRPGPARAVVLGPRGVVDAQDPYMPWAVTVRLRNTSATAWGSGTGPAARLLFTDERGRPRAHCGATHAEPARRRTARRAVATFRLFVCPPGRPPATVTAHVRLTLETLGGTIRGPVFPVRVAFPAPPPEAGPEEPGAPEEVASLADDQGG